MGGSKTYGSYVSGSVTTAKILVLTSFCSCIKHLFMSQTDKVVQISHSSPFSRNRYRYNILNFKTHIRLLIRKMIKSESYLLRIQNIVVKQVLYPVDNCKGRYISTCGIATDIFTVHCRHPVFLPVLRIRIHMFLGLPDPDPLVRGMDPDPDPSIILQK